MDAEKAGSHVNDYRANIRANIRGLWLGAISRTQFVDNMESAIDRYLRFAFAEGAAGCGIKPEDYTEEEEAAISNIVANEYHYIGDLADAIEAGSKANGGKLEPLNTRAELWLNRYKDVVNRGKMMACSDRKYKWTLGQTEHCSTCARLAGQVRRGSFWAERVMPQQPPNLLLECGGWLCQCTLDETSAPCNHGPLPRMP